jgi:hypothetical protein
MTIAHSHSQFFMSKECSDRSQINASHCQIACKAMSEVMEMEIFNPGPPKKDLVKALVR